MKHYWLLLLIVCSGWSCRKNYQAPLPQANWDKFDSPVAKNLHAALRTKVEGIYQVKVGKETFGSRAALKWSYQVNAGDTLHTLSIFCQKEVVYMICEGRRVLNQIVFKGYWRNLLDTQTGTVRLTVNLSVSELLNTLSPTKIIISGKFGLGESVPKFEMQLQFISAIKPNRKVDIVAHRGGGRTSDLLPASENSVQIIKMASQLGASGVEIDVRLTKDGVPVLYHDATLNQRSVQRNGMVGAIENYTYEQLSNLVRLPNGEKIPTLRDALNTIVTETPLTYVWLDTKFKGSILPEYALQQEFLEKAKALGRTVSITIGIPDKEVYKNFILLPDHLKIPSVCELSPAEATAVNAQIWAPRWTLGLLNDEVLQMHNQGKSCFVWTLDVPKNISKYLTDSNFDGILSNYAPSVAYFYYAR